MMDNVQKTGPASPCTPKSTKRNLSSSSISPSQNDKKTKVYVTPNRFALLATNDTNDIATTTTFANLKEDPVNSPSIERDKGHPAPPIHVKDIKNYSAFNKVLTNITDPNGFTCRSTSLISSYNLRIGKISIKSLTIYMKQMLASIHTPPVTFAHTGKLSETYTFLP
jgi:hypothetical protein